MAIHPVWTNTTRNRNLRQRSSPLNIDLVKSNGSVKCPETWPRQAYCHLSDRRERTGVSIRCRETVFPFSGIKLCSTTTWTLLSPHRRKENPDE